MFVNWTSGESADLPLGTEMIKSCFMFQFQDRSHFGVWTERNPVKKITEVPHKQGAISKGNKRWCY